MKKRLLTLLLFLFFTVNIPTTSKANTDTIIIEGATKIIEGLGKIETATKGKKLQKFFSGNTLRLLIDGKTKEYKFQEKNTIKNGQKTTTSTFNHHRHHSD